MERESVEELARAIRHASRGVVALTGAGVSVASGIPSFRDEGGLWDRYDPMEYATLAAFDRDPDKVWRLLHELDATAEAAEPNPSHRALAVLETRGLLTSIVTQNIDGLHHAAGSERVIELHGSRRSLTCRSCGRGYGRAEVDLSPPRAPTCRGCSGPLKPDVTLFGEALPDGAIQRAEHAVRHCSVLIVAGTSADVYPAARLPDVARCSGAQVWEVNPDPTLEADGCIVAPSEQALPALARTLLPEGGPWRALLGALRASAGRWIG